MSNTTAVHPLFPEPCFLLRCPAPSGRATGWNTQQPSRRREGVASTLSSPACGPPSQHGGGVPTGLSDWQQPGPATPTTGFAGAPLGVATTGRAVHTSRGKHEPCSAAGRPDPCIEYSCNCIQEASLPSPPPSRSERVSYAPHLHVSAPSVIVHPFRR